jgi:hypothetical protein
MIDGNMVMFEPMDRPTPKMDAGVPVYKTTKAITAKNVDHVHFKAGPVSVAPLFICLSIISFSLYNILIRAFTDLDEWITKKLSRKHSREDQ